MTTLQDIEQETRTAYTELVFATVEGKLTKTQIKNRLAIIHAAEKTVDDFKGDVGKFTWRYEIHQDILASSKIQGELAEAVSKQDAMEADIDAEKRAAKAEYENRLTELDSQRQAWHDDNGFPSRAAAIEGGKIQDSLEVLRSEFNSQMLPEGVTAKDTENWRIVPEPIAFS